MTKQLNEYLREAKKHLYCEKQAQAVFEQRVHTAVSDIQAERPDVSWEECAELLGPPEQMAEEYMQEFSQEDINRYLHRQRRKRTVAIVASVLTLLTLTGAALVLWFVKVTYVVNLSTAVSDISDIGSVQSIPNMLQENKEELK